MQDGDISSIKFHKILQEVEKYCKLKADIRNQTLNRGMIDHRRIARRRKEGREDV